MIRDAQPEDWNHIWPFFRQIVSAGETYAYDRELSKPEAERLWMLGSLGFTVLATVPEAFNHPTHGYVGLHIMHRFL